MLSQILAPYGMAADFVMRLQREILGQWLDDWAAIMAAAGGGERPGRRRTFDVLEPSSGASTGSTNGSGKGPGTRPVPASYGTDNSPPSTTAGTDDRRLRMIKDVEEALILHRAYLKWLGEGRPDGQHLRHYFEAAQEVRG